MLKVKRLDICCIKYQGKFNLDTGVNKMNIKNVTPGNEDTKEKIMFVRLCCFILATSFVNKALLNC
ncbi:hypothetical protein VCR4J2_750252 [Vibrio coralliirubri]|nr:hypothetical protein VCR4J2_750252 [Vibrio coralliirubri]